MPNEPLGFRDSTFWTLQDLMVMLVRPSGSV